MPTPIGHSLAGLAAFLAAGRRAGARNSFRALGLVSLANLPDIDFLPGYIFGTPRAYHWGPTHSITAAITVGCVVGAGARLGGTRFAPAFLLAIVAYGSHILMDLLLGLHAHPSVGLQVLWPFSPEKFMLPWSVFVAAPKVVGRGPVGLLFSPEALPLYVREIAVMTPVVLASWLVGRRARRAETSQFGMGS